jgi:hypothetical protein
MMPKYRCDRIHTGEAGGYGVAATLTPMDEGFPLTITTADPKIVARLRVGGKYTVGIDRADDEGTAEPYLPDRINNY